MKNIILIIVFLLGVWSISAQAPMKFNYQAVARDMDSHPYQSTNLGIRVSLVQGGTSGVVSYSERHLVTTSNLGVFSLQIGSGTVLEGNLSTVDWGIDSYYIKVDMDPSGGTDYINMGVNQLLSVPYALYAEKAGNGGGVDGDTDPENELQTISLNGTQIVLSNGGGTINLPTGVTDTDDQTLTFNGTSLSIADGNTVDLSPLQDGVTDADSDPINELQMLSFNSNNNTLSLSNGNTVTIPTGGTDADADPFNEIQTLSLSGTQISLSDGGGVINLPTGTTDTDNQTLTLDGTILSIDDGNSVNLSPLQDGVDDADADPSNELQVLNKSGQTVMLSNGGGSFTDDIDDADNNPENELQMLTFNTNNNTLSLSNGNTVTIPTGGTDADADPLNEIQVISLNGTQISLSNGGGAIDLPTGTIDTDDQTLTLNGTTLSIDDGNSIDLSSLQDGVNDADNNPENEIQTIEKSGDVVTLSNGGGNFIDAVDDADNNSSNEIQIIGINGSEITLSNGGGTISLPQSPVDTDDQTLSFDGVDLTIDNGNTVDLSALKDGVTDADADPENELQILSLADNELSISGGNTIDLTSIASPWSIVGGGISYLDGTTHANGIIANMLDFYSFDNHTVLSAAELGFENTFANVSSSFNNDKIQFSTGLSYSRLKAGHLHLTGAETADLRDNQLSFSNTSGRSSLMTASLFQLADQTSNNFFNVSAETGINFGDDSKIMTWNFDNLNYTNFISGATSSLYPSELYFFNQYSDQVSSGFSSSQVGFTDGVNNSHLNSTELVIKDTPSNYKVRISGINEGKVRLYNSDHNETVTIKSSNQKTGQIILKDTAGKESIRLSHVTGSLSHGYVAIKANEDEKVVLYATSGEVGRLRLRGKNGSTNVLLSNSNDNSGALSLYDNGDRRLVYLNATHGNAGYMEMKATNIGANSRNALLTWLSGYVGHGYFSVNDWSGISQAGMFVNSDGDGVVFADIKNFRMDHPTQKGKEIWYASLEGPEAGAYERGTANIENGTTFVKFSDHFQLVGNHETMTVSLTPLSADTYGLAVIEKRADGFVVKELAGGNGSFSFDWEVKCVRKGHENYRVIRDEKESQPAIDESRGSLID